MHIRNGRTALGAVLLALVPVLAVSSNVHSQTQSSTKPALTQSAPPNPPQPSLTEQIAKSVAFISVPYGDAAKPDFVSGTCFFVFLPDERLGKGGGFVYLVTNRHVASAEGVPKDQLLAYVSIRANVSQADGTARLVLSRATLAGKFRWYFPDDPTIDLAALPVVPHAGADIKAIPVSFLGTDEVLKSQAITIGDPVFFVGFFFQFPGISRIDPIYRSGTIAMMPSDPIPMHDKPDDAGTPEHLYLADAHAFHGNSGSPLFVTVGGYRNGRMLLAGQPVYLIGVVNGFIQETNNANATGAATFEGAEGHEPNSGILTFVPAQELRNLLYSPDLQHVRDMDAAASQHRP
jgi:hypothetical protein